MKQLALRIKFFDSDGKPVSKFDIKDQETTKKLELSWTCTKCKYRVIRQTETKPTYDETDLLKMANTAFEFAFYNCACQSPSLRKAEVPEV